jgi:phage-related protein
MPRETILWIEPNGTEHNLSGQSNIDVLIGPQNRFMPPINLVEQEVPFQTGSRLRQVNIKAREVDLPLEISGLSTSDLRTTLRNIMNWFNPLKGDGVLKVIAEDGIQRLLNCRYSGGLDIQETGQTWQRVILVLKAFDPFWYDSSTIVQTFTTGQPATFFPFFPLRLSSSTVFADTSIVNNSDVEAWPEWILQGPGDTIFLRNLTTGELTNLNTSLGVGEIITINTKPGKKTVKKGDGTNLFFTLSDDSSIWSLQQGTNNIRIEMSNATSQSSVQLSYQNRYWGP